MQRLRTQLVEATFIRHASKSAGGYPRNQKKSRRTLIHRGPFFFEGEPVKRQELLVRQPSYYGKNPASPWRPWQWQPGRNTTADPATYTIAAGSDGIASVKKNKINPEYFTVDVEPDIQKVYRGKELRAEFRKRNELSAYSKHNSLYESELVDFEEPEWRSRIVAIKTKTERFVDPNLLTRGVVKSIDPAERFTYE